MKSVRYAALAVLTLLASCAQPAFARDNGQWSGASEARRQWFSGLVQPDSSPSWPISCCGAADAYEADLYEVDGKEIIAIITDGTGNDSGKVTIPDGTRIKVPAGKVVTGKQAASNPTGHGWVFLGEADDETERHVYCWVAPSGL